MNDWLVRLADSLTHEQIVRASAATYDPNKLLELGLRVDTNIGTNKNRSVGDLSHPLYPDVVVWKPDNFLSPKGKAVLIEKIETERTIERNWREWDKYTDLGIGFNLIVPENQIPNVKQKLAALGITDKTHLQSYKKTGNENAPYEFKKVI